MGGKEQCPDLAHEAANYNSKIKQSLSIFQIQRYYNE